MSKTNNSSQYILSMGWIVATILPALLWVILRNTEMNWACLNFVVIFSAALVMWIFRLVPEYAPAVFIILSTMLLGLAPQSVILSGYSSDSFFMALSVFGIGAVIVKSGLFYRLSLLVLNHLPHSRLLLQMVLFFMGIFLTPVMTAQSSRVTLMAHFLEDMRKTAGFKPNSVAANGLACAAFHGSILLSIIFLTGKSSNFVLYGMLSEQVQWQYHWLNWFLTALVPGSMLILSFLIIMAWMFRQSEKVVVDKSLILRELKNLGSFSINEWAALASVLTLLLGLISFPWHQIPSAWLSFAIFFVLITSGILNKNDFKNGINWPFLFYLGAIIGIMRCVQSIGIDQWIIDSFYWLITIADRSLISFIILLFSLSWVGALAFGTMAAPALLFAIFLPIAQHTAVNTWLVAFVILMASESWLFPYQSSYFLCYEETLAEKKAYQLGPTLKLNSCFILLRLLAIIASLPIWQWMGII